MPGKKSYIIYDTTRGMRKRGSWRRVPSGLQLRFLILTSEYSGGETFANKTWQENARQIINYGIVGKIRGEKSSFSDRKITFLKRTDLFGSICLFGNFLRPITQNLISPQKCEKVTFMISKPI